MNANLPGDQRQLFLATALATRREQRLALAVVVVSFLAFLAIIPFVRVPLARMPAFIPSYEAALFFIDLITALLLFDQFFRLRALGVLVLASGYLFDAFIIVPHALSFPGAFTTTGLLGAMPQTTAWLYVFWHGGFPLFVIAYARLRNHETNNVSRPGLAVALSIAGVLLLAIAFTALTTAGHDWLPVVMQGSDYSLLVSKGISPAVWLLTLVAVLMLWQRRERAVDLWLTVVMSVWLFDIALSAVIGSTRFDLGFYAGRLFGLIAASFLLVTMLVEMARLYSGAMAATMSAEQRLSQLARMRSQSEMQARHGEPTEAFIHRQNIAHYRTLLQSASLDEAQRRSIEKLLKAEEQNL